MMTGMAHRRGLGRRGLARPLGLGPLLQRRSCQQLFQHRRRLLQRARILHAQHLRSLQTLLKSCPFPLFCPPIPLQERPSAATTVRTSRSAPAHERAQKPSQRQDLVKGSDCVCLSPKGFERCVALYSYCSTSLQPANISTSGAACMWWQLRCT